MDLLREGFAEAWRLVVSGDGATFHALGVSLETSLVALLVAALLGIPFGAWLALFRPPGHRWIVLIARGALGIPTVVIGLLLWSLLTRQGLLGDLELIPTKAAITIGQTLLALPILITFTHAAMRALDGRVVETVRTLGGGRWRTLRCALGEARPALAAALLTAFARCITELGIALMVGFGVSMQTRTLPAQIVLEINKGEFATALASGLLITLLGVAAALAAPLALGEERE